MNYRTFVNQTAEKLSALFPEGTQIKVCPVSKNNSVLIHSILIRPEGSSLALCISGTDLYDYYKKGIPMDKILPEIMNSCQKELAAGNALQDMLKDPGIVRSNAVCTLVNRKMNEKLLEGVPHQIFLDLAVVYYCRLELENGVKGSFLIQKAHLPLWNMTEEELEKCAMENTKRLLPMRFDLLQTVMEEISGTPAMPVNEETEEGTELYILTNTENVYGAFWITQKEALEQIATELGGDFYVLPSSVHECLILRPSSQHNEQSLASMVREVNFSVVSEKDILSCSIYRYNAQTGELIVACSGD